MDVAARLEALARTSTCRLTVRGRKSGKAFPVTIWFAVDRDRIYLETLDPRRNWVRNGLAVPAVEIEIGALRFAAQFAVVTDPAEIARATVLFVGKYWAAWVGSWFGLGPKGVYCISDLRPLGPA